MNSDKPTVTVTHNDVQPPRYTNEEIEGLKEQALRLSKHIEILREEIASKEAQLRGILTVIKENEQN